MGVRAEFPELAGHDAYELLGLSPEASDRQIQRAYRTLVKARHPDLFPDSHVKAEAEENVRLLNAARDVLTRRRTAYDTFRNASKDGAVPQAPPSPHPSATAPPLDVRSFGRRMGIGCAIAWGCLLVIGIGVTVLADHLRSSPGSEPAVAVPESFTGTWAGVFGGRGASHDGGWEAEITLRQGKHNGQVRYLNGQCTGIAVPISNVENLLTLHTVFSDAETGCDIGDIRLTQGGDDKLNVSFVKGDTVNDSGKLTRR